MTISLTNLKVANKLPLSFADLFNPLSLNSDFKNEFINASKSVLNTPSLNIFSNNELIEKIIKKLDRSYNTVDHSKPYFLPYITAYRNALVTLFTNKMKKDLMELNDKYYTLNINYLVKIFKSLEVNDKYDFEKEVLKLSKDNVSSISLDINKGRAFEVNFKVYGHNYDVNSYSNINADFSVLVENADVLKKLIYVPYISKLHEKHEMINGKENYTHFNTKTLVLIRDLKVLNKSYRENLNDIIINAFNALDVSLGNISNTTKIESLESHFMAIANFSKIKNITEDSDLLEFSNKCYEILQNIYKMGYVEEVFKNSTIANSKVTFKGFMSYAARYSSYEYEGESVSKVYDLLCTIICNEVITELNSFVRSKPTKTYSQLTLNLRLELCKNIIKENMSDAIPCYFNNRDTYKGSDINNKIFNITCHEFLSRFNKKEFSYYAGCTLSDKKLFDAMQRAKENIITKYSKEIEHVDNILREVNDFYESLRKYHSAINGSTETFYTYVFKK